MRKIAILGGGIAGLTAAWELTRTPELCARHQVTVYQMGFRLGGKLASGRMGPEAKNVEHGLHVWFGFYENAFGLLRQLYAEWPKDPRGPFQTWTDVMEPRSYTPIGYQLDGAWGLYPQLWFTNSDLPGDGRVDLSLFGVITELLSVFDRLVFHRMTHAKDEFRVDLPTWVDRFFEDALGWVVETGAEHADSPFVSDLHRRWRRVTRALAEHATVLVGEYPGIVRFVLARIARLVHRRIARYTHGPAPALMDWLLADYVLSMLRGLLNPAYGLLVHRDLDRLNNLEFMQFMRENGASQALLDSTFMRVIYETAFQYVEGDLRRPNVEAGTCLRIVFRMLFTYKGAMLWEVKGGMGDVLIAPLYEVLKQRGVRFEFFHKVDALRLSADRTQVEAVELGVQAMLREPYDPLITLDYAPCWPSTPRWEYLVDGERLRQAEVDFESNWCTEPYAELKRIERGVDFDDVVLALALGAFKPLNSDRKPCDELISASARFGAMVHGLGLAPSQALQVWFDRNLAELGFDHQRFGCDGLLPAAVDGPDPFDIWADMTPVLEVEQWRGDRPRSVHYLCGVLQTPLYKEPRSNQAVPALAKALVRDNAINWLSQYAGLFWPKACIPGSWALDWNTLIDPEGRHGPERLDAQYYRANIDPTECCVGTTVGSSKLRLGTGESGFRNLYLAGAWTKTPMNVECVEGAVMSGMAAARALCGFPRLIVGEDFLR